MSHKQRRPAFTPETFEAFASGCRGKQIYSSKSVAMSVAQKMRRIYGLIFNYYKCRACHHWHVGKRTEQP